DPIEQPEHGGAVTQLRGDTVVTIDEPLDAPVHPGSVVGHGYALKPRGVRSPAVAVHAERNPAARFRPMRGNYLCNRSTAAGSLPEVGAIRGGEIELLPGLDVKRLVPRVDIAHRRGAIHRRGVTVGVDLVARDL